MRVAVVQFAPRFRDREANWRTVLRAAGSATAELVVFPELSSCGYMYRSREEIEPFADSREALRPLEELARQTGRAFVGGFAERAPDGLYNSAYVVRPDATEVFRKIHLWNYETQIFRPGASPLVFDFAGHRFGVEVCYDLQFPELGAYYARRGVEALLVPMAWALEPIRPEDGLQPYNHLALATAFAHGIFVAVANRTGPERGAEFPGQSSVTDPYGRQRRLNGAEGSLEAELDFGLGAAARRPTEFNDLRGDARLTVEVAGGGS